MSVPLAELDLIVDLNVANLPTRSFWKLIETNFNGKLPWEKLGQRLKLGLKRPVRPRGFMLPHPGGATIPEPVAGEEAILTGRGSQFSSLAPLTKRHSTLILFMWTNKLKIHKLGKYWMHALIYRLTQLKKHFTMILPKQTLAFQVILEVIIPDWIILFLIHRTNFRQATKTDRPFQNIKSCAHHYHIIGSALEVNAVNLMTYSILADHAESHDSITEMNYFRQWSNMGENVGSW